MVKFLRSNGLKVVFGMWAGVVALTLMHNWGRRDISTGQKLVNARVAAQVSALGALGVLIYYLPSSRAGSRRGSDNGHPGGSDLPGVDPGDGF